MNVKLGTTCGVLMLTVVLTMVVTACDAGNGRLSAREYTHEASRVCRRSNRALEGIAIPRSSPPRAVSRSIAKIVEVHRGAVDALRALEPPSHLATTVQKWIALLDQGGDELALMTTLLRTGRPEAAFDYGAKATVLLGRAQEVVAPLGVTSCRGPRLVTA